MANTSLAATVVNGARSGARSGASSAAASLCSALMIGCLAGSHPSDTHPKTPPPGPDDTGSPTDSPPDSSPLDSSPPDSTADSDSAPPPDTGTANVCGDPAVIPAFSSPAAPALSPVTADSDHGSDNIYAPDVVRVSDSLCLMYYGGQGSDGHDRIFVATSTDCATWAPWPDRSDPQPVIDRGSSNHVNDPSIVVVGGIWYLYYTDAATAEDDRVHLATSADGFVFNKQGPVLGVGGGGAWDSVKVGRPSVVFREDTYWLYYDGNDGVARHVGLARSADGRTFERHAANPLVLNAGAVDVERIADTWVMLQESGAGTLAATSADGITWCDRGLVLALSGGAWDAYGQVTPFVYSQDGSRFDALLYGGASDACWCRNRIGEAMPEGTPAAADPDAGCGGCVANSDCTEACRDGGYGVDGYCAVPGSVDPNACCACVSAP